MTEELEKCPFCGSDEVEVVSPFDGQLSDYGTVKCYKCECHGPLVDMVGGYWKPIKAWNTRAALQSALDAQQSNADTVDLDALKEKMISDFEEEKESELGRGYELGLCHAVDYLAQNYNITRKTK